MLNDIFNAIQNLVSLDAAQDSAVLKLKAKAKKAQAEARTAEKSSQQVKKESLHKMLQTGYERLGKDLPLLFAAPSEEVKIAQENREAIKMACLKGQSKAVQVAVSKDSKARSDAQKKLARAFTTSFPRKMANWKNAAINYVDDVENNRDPMGRTETKDRQMTKSHPVDSVVQQLTNAHNILASENNADKLLERKLTGKYLQAIMSDIEALRHRIAQYK
jgi:hypothetical protein